MSINYEADKVKSFWEMQESQQGGFIHLIRQSFPVAANNFPCRQRGQQIPSSASGSNKLATTLLNPPSRFSTPCPSEGKKTGGLKHSGPAVGKGDRRLKGALGA